MAEGHWKSTKNNFFNKNVKAGGDGVDLKTKWVIYSVKLPISVSGRDSDWLWRIRTDCGAIN